MKKSSLQYYKSASWISVNIDDLKNEYINE